MRSESVPINAQDLYAVVHVEGQRRWDRRQFVNLGGTVRAEGDRLCHADTGLQAQRNGVRRDGEPSEGLRIVAASLEPENEIVRSVVLVKEHMGQIGITTGNRKSEAAWLAWSVVMQDRQKVLESIEGRFL